MYSEILGGVPSMDLTLTSSSSPSLLFQPSEIYLVHYQSSHLDIPITPLRKTTTMAEFPPPSLQPLIQEVFELLKARNETVSVAETVCTPDRSSTYVDTYRFQSQSQL
jgi:hypothetical protein